MRKQTLIAWAFLTPALILLAAFSFWPVLFGSYLAFTEYNLLDAPRWVGLDNFRDLFADELFWSAMKNSALYLLVVPLIQLPAILAAVLVNNQLPGMRWYRAAFYLPVVTTVSVVGVIWNFMYADTGLLNTLLNWLHVINQPVGWLSDDRIALLSVMFVTIWRGFGWYMVLYLAGLQSIPADIHQAAMLDGASVWQRFRHLTLPLLMPTILLCSLMSMLAALKAFEEIQIMTQGGPFESTYTALYYSYQFGIKSLNFGRALAASLVMSVFCIVLAWLNFRYLQPRESHA
ncbi:sugar ABC transporter permease [Burkholderiaceae bacterium DAT-1]|nr:sugar ABC transporter permease [Burkholderiaceae bacterium DAT-1]